MWLARGLDDYMPGHADPSAVTQASNEGLELTATTEQPAATSAPSVPYAAAAYLSVIQFFFATTWTIYVIYLPSLAESVGISRATAVWLLVLDQLTFTATDFVMGFAADRVGRLLGRVGPFIVAMTATSCAFFFAIPHIAGSGSPLAKGLFLVCLFVWVATSSALRAPPWTFLVRYAATPSLPWLAALSLVGVAVGGASAPYLGVALRNVDPRIPFALSSATLFATALGLIWVERALARGAPARADTAHATAVDGAQRPALLATPGMAVFLLAAALLALGYQLHIAFNSIPQYLRFATPKDLDYLLPIFWVSFNLFIFPGAALSPRWGGPQVMAWAAAIGALGALISAAAPNLPATILGQILIGGAWGSMLCGGLALAVFMGRTGREGSTTGLWFSMQSVAAFLRLGVVAVQLDRIPGFESASTWAPAILWAGAAALLMGLALRAATAPTPLARQA